jgi:hypothetical protein
MEFFSLSFLLTPDNGSYDPKLVGKNEFLKRSVGSDCRTNENKYALVICMPTGMSGIKIILHEFFIPNVV